MSEEQQPQFSESTLKDHHIYYLQTELQQRHKDIQHLTLAIERLEKSTTLAIERLVHAVNRLRGPRRN